MITPDFKLTRYLYITEDVLSSLIVSIFEKNYDKSLFWASELYFSGLEKITVEFIYSIYRNFFYSNNPKLDKVMKTGIERFDRGIHIVDTMLLNLVTKSRTYTLQHFMAHELEPPAFEGSAQKETKLWIFANPEKSQKYSTDNMEKDKPPYYRVLRTVCKYETDRKWCRVFGSTYKEMDYKDILTKHINHWLYFASFTPLWEKRISHFNGTVDNDKREVLFENDDDFENFHELYNYDIDEQPCEVIEKISHTSIISKNTINEFYKLYEPNTRIIKVRNLKRINKICSQSK